MQSLGFHGSNRLGWTSGTNYENSYRGRIEPWKPIVLSVRPNARIPDSSHGNPVNVKTTMEIRRDAGRIWYESLFLAWTAYLSQKHVSRIFNIEPHGQGVHLIFNVIIRMWRGGTDKVEFELDIKPESAIQMQQGWKKKKGIKCWQSPRVGDLSFVFRCVPFSDDRVLAASVEWAAVLENGNVPDS